MCDTINTWWCIKSIISKFENRLCIFFSEKYQRTSSKAHEEQQHRAATTTARRINAYSSAITNTRTYFHRNTPNMFGPSAVTTDILDIGSRNGEDKRRQAMASGSGAMCPSKFLGAPAAFDIPNVADVSSSNRFSSSFLSCIVFQHDALK